MFEKRIKSVADTVPVCGFQAQRNLNRYVVEAEELLNGVRRDIMRLGGGVRRRQGGLAVPDDASMVQIQRRVKAISRLQGLAQETAVELEVGTLDSTPCPSRSPVSRSCAAGQNAL